MNWENYTKEITLNGKNFKDISKSITGHSKQPAWIIKHIDFINQFINSSDFITVNTSGSTGKPKKIILKKQTLVTSALNTGDFIELKRGQKSFLCLPGDYIAGKMMIVRTFVLGLNLYWQKPSSIPNIDRNYDFAAMTPIQLENILINNKNSINQIKKLIIGGAPINDFILKEAQSLETQIYETYGMTESASHIALKKINGKDKSDYFTVLPNIEIDKNHDSCLILKNSNLKVGIIQTNDIIELKDKRHFKWKGRKDNIINSGGLKLIPEEIESKLKPYIKNDFFIFGINDNKYGKLPAIVIETDNTTNVTPDFSILNKYERPKKIYILNKFIKTSSGKIDRIKTINILLQKNYY